MYQIPKEVLDQLRARIASLVSDPAYPDDRYIILTVKEAFAALLEGNSGVGAVLVDENGTPVQTGRNRLLYPRFRSDLHAEMDVLTEFELRSDGDRALKGYTLYSSLEPCEMCMIRIIYSGVSKIYFAVNDDKGKTTRREEWAPYWQRLAEKQEFAPARCSPALSEIALHIFQLTAPRTTEKLLARR